MTEHLLSEPQDIYALSEVRMGCMHTQPGVTTLQLTLKSHKNGF